MYKIIKRAFDLVSSLLLFIMISPIFVVLTVLVRIKMGSPVLFRQTRAGKHQKQFQILKFRTMTNECDSNGELLPDEQRKTKLGVWLRATSLDELPEILNIIKGDMSVIGPRPLQPKYNVYYTDYELSRFKVRGGLIPPESLLNNPNPTWDDQLKCEADYANNLSLQLDCKIFFSVFKFLFHRKEEDYGDYVRENLEVERKGKEYVNRQYIPE